MSINCIVEAHGNLACAISEAAWNGNGSSSYYCSGELRSLASGYTSTQQCVEFSTVPRGRMLALRWAVLVTCSSLTTRRCVLSNALYLPQNSHELYMFFGVVCLKLFSILYVSLWLMRHYWLAVVNIHCILNILRGCVKCNWSVSFVRVYSSNTCIARTVGGSEFPPLLIAAPCLDKDNWLARECDKAIKTSLRVEIFFVHEFAIQSALSSRPLQFFSQFKYGKHVMWWHPDSWYDSTRA